MLAPESCMVDDTDPRNGRIQIALSLLKTQDSIRWRELRSNQSLINALSSFSRKGTSNDTPYDVVAFVHAFGVSGPNTRDWDELFRSAGDATPEELAVLIAISAAGSCSPIDVLLGHSESGAPGVLDKVCSLHDDWVLSADQLRKVFGRLVATAANEWSLGKVVSNDNDSTGNYAQFMWWRRRNDDEDLCIHNCTLNKHSLGDGLRVCAKRIVSDELSSLFKGIEDKVSYGGWNRAQSIIRNREAMLVEEAVRQAQSVLVTRMLNAFAEPNLF